MKRLVKLSLAPILFALSGAAGANHKPEAEWSWHVLSAGSAESRLSIYRGDQFVGIYNVDCDLGEASEGAEIDGGASLELVTTESRPDGLLIITCDVGAHAQQLAIIDFSSKISRPAFSVTGSYSARWEIVDGELWIEYDEPCDTGPTVECPDGFATRFVRYPEP